MLYHGYQVQDDLAAALRELARWVRSAGEFLGPAPGVAARRHLSAVLEMVQRFELTHVRPEFGIESVRVGQREAPVREEVVLDLPFGRLLRFAKDDRRAAAAGADRGAAVGAFRHAPARHRRHHAARPRGLHHRLDERPRRAAGGGRLRGGRLSRLPDPLHRGDRPRRAPAGGLPALRADAGGGGGDVGGPQPRHAALDDADGGPGRRAREPDQGERRSPPPGRSPGSGAR